MYPYPSFEDSWLKIISMQIYNTDFVVCAKKQKLRRCKKHKKYNTHTKTFSNYIWLCVVNGKARQCYRIFIMKIICNFLIPSLFFNEILYSESRNLIVNVRILTRAWQTFRLTPGTRIVASGRLWGISRNTFFKKLLAEPSTKRWARNLKSKIYR